MCPQGIEAAFDILIAAVNLLNIVYCRSTFCAHGGKQHGYASPDVRRQHLACTQTQAVVMTYHNGTVGVAENYLCAHINEVVHKEKAAFEHFLMNEHAALALGGNYQNHRQEVWRESGPWSISDRQNGFHSLMKKRV